MHETIIAKQIIDTAKKQGDVVSIHIEIGELAHVPAHELLACLTGLVPWKVTHVIHPASADCACGWFGHPKILEHGHDHFIVECPECGSMPNINDGKDVKLISVKVK